MLRFCKKAWGAKPYPARQRADGVSFGQSLTFSLSSSPSRLLKNLFSGRCVSGHDFSRAEKSFVFVSRAGFSPRLICFGEFFSKLLALRFAYVHALQMLSRLLHGHKDSPWRSQCGDFYLLP